MVTWSKRRFVGTWKVFNHVSKISGEKIRRNPEQNASRDNHTLKHGLIQLYGRDIDLDPQLVKRWPGHVIWFCSNGNHRIGVHLFSTVVIAGMYHVEARLLDLQTSTSTAVCSVHVAGSRKSVEHGGVVCSYFLNRTCPLKLLLEASETLLLLSVRVEWCSLGEGMCQ